MDRSNAAEREPGAQALAHLDAILAKAPIADSALFSGCTQGLAELRDRMITDQRITPPNDADRTRLAHVNAVISVVMAGHFPLGPVPWDELRAARLWLADIVSQGQP